jgi:hypothetical protein
MVTIAATTTKMRGITKLTKPIAGSKIMGMITMNLQQARNLKIGAIYVLKGTYEKVRLLNILPCEGVWVENAEGEGYGKTVPFKHLLYANKAEVQNFLEEVRG